MNNIGTISKDTYSPTSNKGIQITDLTILRIEPRKRFVPDHQIVDTIIFSYIYGLSFRYYIYKISGSDLFLSNTAYFHFNSLLNLYPIPHTVKIYTGFDESGSIFFRILRIRLITLFSAPKQGEFHT